MKKLEMRLNEIRELWSSALVDGMIDDILCKEEDDRYRWMEEVVKYGCISGIVGHLIYRVDIVNYYNMFSDEIDKHIDSLIEEGCIEEGRIKEVNSYYDEEREEEVYYYIDEYEDMIEIDEEEMEDIDIENVEFKVWCTYEWLMCDILNALEEMDEEEEE